MPGWKRGIPAKRRSGQVLLVLASVLAGGAIPAGCGSHAGPGEPQYGTVSLRNETDQGQAPQTVTAFYIGAVGDPDPGPNRLNADVPPGGIVIVGLFPPGFYNAVAVLESGPQVTFMDVEVRAGEPTNFTVPSP